MSRAQRILWVAAGALVVAALAFCVLRARPSAEHQKAPAGRMRIVSLAPSATEMLFILGLGDSVIAVTDYCDYPPEAKRIERIGGFGTPNMEKLLALSPDLVVTAGLERNEVVRSLRAAGVRVVELSKVRTIDEMLEGLRQIGQATGRSQRADELVAAMQAELQTVAARSRQAAGSSPPRVFVELWDAPLTTAGGTSFLDDVIVRAGGVNVAHELTQQHPRVSPEKVIQWNPDAIVVAHMARGGNAAKEVAERLGWSDIAAVKRGRIIHDISSDLILRPGPRLIEGVKALAHRLYETPPEGKSVTGKAGSGLLQTPSHPERSEGSRPRINGDSSLRSE